MPALSQSGVHHRSSGNPARIQTALDAIPAYPTLDDAGRIGYGVLPSELALSRPMRRMAAAWRDRPIIGTTYYVGSGPNGDGTGTGAGTEADPYTVKQITDLALAGTLVAYRDGVLFETGIIRTGGFPVITGFAAHGTIWRCKNPGQRTTLLPLVPIGGLAWTAESDNVYSTLLDTDFNGLTDSHTNITVCLLTDDEYPFGISALQPVDSATEPAMTSITAGKYWVNDSTGELFVHLVGDGSPAGNSQIHRSVNATTDYPLAGGDNAGHTFSMGETTQSVEINNDPVNDIVVVGFNVVGAPLYDVVAGTYVSSPVFGGCVGGSALWEDVSAAYGVRHGFIPMMEVGARLTANNVEMGWMHPSHTLGIWGQRSSGEGGRVVINTIKCTLPVLTYNDPDANVLPQDGGTLHTVFILDTNASGEHLDYFEVNNPQIYNGQFRVVDVLNASQPLLIHGGLIYDLNLAGSATRVTTDGLAVAFRFPSMGGTGNTFSFMNGRIGNVGFPQVAGVTPRHKNTVNTSDSIRIQGAYTATNCFINLDGASIAFPVIKGLAGDTTSRLVFKKNAINLTNVTGGSEFISDLVPGMIAAVEDFDENVWVQGTTDAGATIFCRNYNGSTDYTFAQWQSVLGFDANSQSFTAAKGIAAVECDTQTGRPWSASSPLVDAGTDTGPATDATGIVLPVRDDIGPWELGSLELVNEALVKIIQYLHNQDQSLNVAASPTFAGLSITGGTGTASSDAVTINAASGRITTESKTTAAAAAYTITLTDSFITATSKVFAAVNVNGGTGTPVVASVVPGAGSCAITIHNAETVTVGNPFNTAHIIDFLVIQP